MRIIHTLLFLAIINIVDAQSLSTGPYIFYENGKTYISGVQKDVPYKDSTANGQLQKVSIAFDDHPDWNFTVPLKSAISIEPVSYAAPRKMLVLSDIEGEFHALRSLLLAAKVIDTQYNWTFGNGHLVFCGDLFDRGNQVVEVLWLMYLLEQKASEKGGYVHTILGNHDIMNLSGNTKYVQPHYFKAAEIMGRPYTDWYTNQTELGRWLRSKNIIEKVGDNICMHAGISPKINSFNISLEKINQLSRPYYDRSKETKTSTNDTLKTIFDSESAIFWYRGYFKEPKATAAEVDETLRIYGAKRIIVGHTIVPGNVGFYYNKKVLGIDVNQHKGVHQAALYENKKWYKIDEKGQRTLL